MTLALTDPGSRAVSLAASCCPDLGSALSWPLLLGRLPKVGRQAREAIQPQASDLSPGIQPLEPSWPGQGFSRDVNQGTRGVALGMGAQKRTGPRSGMRGVLGNEPLGREGERRRSVGKGGQTQRPRAGWTEGQLRPQTQHPRIPSRTL